MYYVIKLQGGFYAGISPTGRRLTVPTLEGATILGEDSINEAAGELTGTNHEVFTLSLSAAPDGTTAELLRAKLKRFCDDVIEEELSAACATLGIESPEQVDGVLQDVVDWVMQNREAMRGAVSAVAGVLNDSNLAASEPAIRAALLQQGQGDRMHYMRVVPDACAFMMSKAPIH